MVFFIINMYIICGKFVVVIFYFFCCKKCCDEIMVYGFDSLKGEF